MSERLIFYDTMITCSDYNPNIDSTITVTVKCLSKYDGSPVVGEQVEIKCTCGNFVAYNGSTITSVQSYTGVTNSNGSFSLSYNCSEWGLCTFSTNNSNIQVSVTGWRTAWSDSNYSVVYNKDLVSVNIFYGGNVNYTTTAQEFGAEILKHGSIDLRPKMPMIQISPAGDCIYISDISYKLKYFRLNGTNSAGAYASFTYKRK